MEVVETTFSELIIAFQNYSRNKIVDTNSSEVRNILTEADIIELRNDFKIQRILEKTQLLNFVSFETLKGTELLALFINLLNLMICHCYLSTKLDSTDGVYSNNFPNRDIGYMFLGYNLGDLGFVSIYDLKVRIVGEAVRPIFSVRENDAWNELNIEPDPRTAYIVTDFRSTSPRLQFCKSDQIENQLNESMRGYVQTFVSFSDGHIVMSELLGCYLDNVLVSQGQSLENQSQDDDRRLKLLVDFLNDYASDEFKKQLNELSSGKQISFLLTCF